MWVGTGYFAAQGVVCLFGLNRSITIRNWRETVSSYNQGSARVSDIEWRTPKSNNNKEKAVCVSPFESPTLLVKQLEGSRLQV